VARPRSVRAACILFAIGAIAIGAPALLPAPATAEPPPSPREARQQVDARHQRAEVAAERYDDVRVEVFAARAARADRAARAEAPTAKRPSAGTAAAPTRTVGPTAAASRGAAAAVATAVAQVGDPYAYGATGPGAFDCSGLTMYAWRAAGRSLPHSSRMQFAAGGRVAKSALLPGDLVFYYSPIHHVGIYVGNGRIVDAANPRTGVRVAGLDSMPFTGAVRP
jgi:cell wall-associated NlpC family hydrolase